MFSYSSVRNISCWFNNQLLRLFHYVLVALPSSIFQPGWKPATAELQTNNCRRFWEEHYVKKQTETLSPTKTRQNKTLLERKIKKWIQKHNRFLFRKIRKFPYENLNFSIDKLLQFLFLLYPFSTKGILHANFRLIWTILWPNRKTLIKIRYSQNWQTCIRRTIFFLDKL